MVACPPTGQEKQRTFAIVIRATFSMVSGNASEERIDDLRDDTRWRRRSLGVASARL
jgi:hypothetical protein